MRLIDGDYLYNKLVANKCPYDLVLQMVKDEPTVCDIPPFINKLCVSSGMCHEDKMKVLEQIRTEIEQRMQVKPNNFNQHDESDYDRGLYTALNIIDKYTKGQTE